MDYWRCAVCDIVIHLKCRDSHLAGKRHATAAEANQQRILQARRSQEDRNQWTCTVCNIKMRLHCRDSHLAGNRHAMAARSRQRESRLEPGMEILERATNGTSSPVAKVLPSNVGVAGNIREALYESSDLKEVQGATAVSVWQCTMCNCFVPMSAKKTHLSGVDHVQKLLESIKLTCLAIPLSEVDVSDTDPVELERTGYKDAVNGSKILASYLANNSFRSTAQPNQKSKSGTRKPEARSWTCPDCKTVLAATQKDQHSCPDPQTDLGSSNSPLDLFFLAFPGFWYDPTIPPAESFSAFKRGLRRWNEWDGNSPATWKEYEEEISTRYQAALTQEFNLWFGREDDLQSWHSLCRAVAIHPLPMTCKSCREAVRNRHVNIVDLIQWARDREEGEVRIFNTVEELAAYSYEEGKIYRKNQMEQGVVLRHLLRRLDRTRST